MIDIMRISKVLWISAFLMIGVAINFYAFPANASPSYRDHFSRTTEASNVGQTLTPYRGSGR